MKPSVFISYSHRDESCKDRLVEQLGPLIDTARIEAWHDRRIAPGREWFTEIEAAIDRAAIAVCLISQHFLRSSFCMQHEVAPLLARRERRGLVLLPVLVAPCAWNTVHWLKPMQMLPRDGKPIAQDRAGPEDEAFAELAREVVRVLDDPSHRPPSVTDRASGPVAAELSQLAYTGFDLVGRDAELARLNIAWRSHETHLVGVFGWGGVGKTTLMNKWLEGLDGGVLEGAVRAYGWSFIGDVGSGQLPSSDAFVHAALEWFGDRAPGLGSPWSKGERLAELVAKERTLLVIDGIEVFQSTAAPTKGQVMDPALATLLFELAGRNSGLCVVTSREPLVELRSFARTVAFENLERLSHAAGRAVLRLEGVRGIDEAGLERASRALNGNALALRLLAVHLQAGSGQGRERVDELLRLDAVAEGCETSLLLSWVEEHIENSAAREVLCLVGMLDGMAEVELLDVLRGSPIAVGLNENTHAIDEREWRRLLADLRRRNLLLPEDERAPERLTSHPLVAAHFAAKMCKSAPTAWSAAHARLAEHHERNVHESPSTLDEATPALRTVYHRARAGKLAAALDLYYRAVDEGNRHRATELNAPGAVLSALMPFYCAQGWAPRPGLDVDDQAYLLNSTGALLRALGRLDDAIAVFREALAVRNAQGNLADASKNASALAEVALVGGQIDVARRFAEEAVRLAEAARSAGQVIYCLTTYGDVLHQAGELENAMAAFQRAEQIHRDVIVARGFPIDILYRLPGIRYCDCLLSRGDAEQVLRRATVLSASGPDISAEETAYGLAICAEAMRLDAGASGVFVRGMGRINAIGFADLALDRMRATSRELYLPKLLVIRARNYLAVDDLAAATRDLERASRVARRNAAMLFELDAQIDEARLEAARGNRDRAIGIVEKVSAAVAEVGYGRGARAVAEIGASLGAPAG